MPRDQRIFPRNLDLVLLHFGIWCYEFMICKGVLVHGRCYRDYTNRTYVYEGLA